MNRIIQLDMLRGYALLCIMIDHMPVSVLREGTLARFMIFDAAELFVLLSGFLVGLVWVMTEAREGLKAARWRFARRAFEVWRALVIGALIMAALSAWLLANGYEHRAIWNGYAAWLVEDPLNYLISVASMWLQPNLLDVLAVYVILIASAPILVPLLRRWPLPFAAVSVVLWWFAPELNMMIIPSHEKNGMLFNPFGWQMLFFSGVAMGLFRKEMMPKLMEHSRLLTVIAAAVVLYGMVIDLAPLMGETGKTIRETLKPLYGEINKWRLDETRFMAIIAASWLVAVPLAPPLRWLAQTLLGRAMSDIGRGGLWSFFICVLLSVLGDAMQRHPEVQTVPIRLAIDLWAITALWLAAYLYHEIKARRLAKSSAATRTRKSA
ncbi:OpgC domain-containing protein [Paracoccaceae bacterium GXU_MW_L88]